MPLLKINQPTFAAGELSNAVRARVDLAKYRAGLKTASNVIIHPQGGLSNRAGMIFTGEVKDSERAARMIPFQFSVQVAYLLEFGHETMRVYKGGAQVLAEIESDVTSVQYNAEDFWRFNIPVGHDLHEGDEVFIFPTGADISPSLMNRNLRVFDMGAGFIVLEDMFGTPLQGPLPTVTGARIQQVYVIDTPYDADDLDQLVFVQEADVMYITHRDYPVQKLSRLGDNDWTMEDFDTGTDIDPPSPAPVATQRAPWDTDDNEFEFQYKVSSINEDGEESLPSAASAAIQNNLTINDNANVITWTAVTGAERYIVYKLDNGVYGYIGGTEALTFTDNNITADLSDTPQKARNPFNAPGNYPGVVCFHEQRLVFGSTYNNPGLVEMSQSANYQNFGRASPAKASDSISFRIRARQVNEIRALVSGDGLMIFTAGGEWSVTGGQQDFISPSQIVTKKQGNRGSSTVQPLEIGETLLFAQRTGAAIRDFRYDFAQDKFTGDDLTVLSRHLFEGMKIKAWAYAQSPDSVVWVVFEDGSMASLTYMREHEVWAWARQSTTNGAYEDVVVINEELSDVPYFLVRRTINGYEKRYIERLHDRDIPAIRQAFFMDSGLTLSSVDDVTVITGLWHLVGQAVAVLADGDVIHDLTVDSDGSIELPEAAGLVHVGLPYLAQVEPISPDIGDVRGLGSTQGRPKNIVNVLIKVERTRGLWVGPSEGELEDQEYRMDEEWDTPVLRHTGNDTIPISGEWGEVVTLMIEQRDPLPMTILSIIPEVAPGV